VLWLLPAIAWAAGCYSGARATRDVNDSWRGRSSARILAHWGRPAEVGTEGGLTTLRWRHARRHIELPSASAEVSIEPGRFDARAELRPGSTWKTYTEVVARVDPRGSIVDVRGPSLRWGAPRDANLRWGTLLGMHVGFGRLDDTSTPLPSGGAYIGGMLTPTVGLVGCFSMVSGSDDAGGAMGFAWGIAPQWWMATRLWVRAGPAMILAFDPGFENAGLEPGATGGLSYAAIRSGSFVLDLRVDVAAGTSTAFGSVGVGVNVN
jgi:hypothetical protein